MKDKAKALTEWALGEITFEIGSERESFNLTQEQFAIICKRMRGKEAPSLPILEEDIAQLKTHMRRSKPAKDALDRTEAWLDEFFQPSRILQYRSIYEVKYAMQRAIKKLQDTSPQRA